MPSVNPVNASRNIGRSKLLAFWTTVWRIGALPIVASLSIMAGCQSIQDTRAVIHLHPAGLEEDRTARIVHLLEAGGYRVELRTNPSPFLGHGNTLIYGGSGLVNHDAETVIATLENEGYFVASVYASEARNHRYTARHIGLYMDPVMWAAEPLHATDFDKEPLSITDVEFSANDCGPTYVAHFEPDGSVVFYAEGEFLESATWRSLDDQTVVVVGGQNVQHYEILKSNLRSQQGITRTITLLPQGGYRIPFGCDYSGSLYYPDIGI